MRKLEHSCIFTVTRFNFRELFQLYNMMSVWLTEVLGRENFILDFVDESGNGRWMLHVPSEQDLVAFKLRFGGDYVLQSEP